MINNNYTLGDFAGRKVLNVILSLSFRHFRTPLKITEN